jgi:predicted nuclease with TOPRIM domain
MLARRKILIVIIMAFLMAVIGCQSEEEAPVEQTTRPEVAPQPETTARVEETVDPKVAFRETMQKQVAELERDIETLQAKSAEIPAESKEEFNQMMQSLQSQKEVVKERLEALKGESLGEWETLKSSTEEALKELKNSYQNVANRFSS